MELRQLKDKAAEAFTKGRFSKAAELYEEYCRADPKDHQSRLRLGDAWAKAGQRTRAISAYHGAAEGFAREGFLPRAIAASKLILELDPAHQGVQQMLADLYARRGTPSRPRPGGSGAPAEAPASATATGPQVPVSATVSAARATPSVPPAPPPEALESTGAPVDLSDELPPELALPVESSAAPAAAVAQAALAVGSVEAAEAAPEQVEVSVSVEVEPETEAFAIGVDLEPEPARPEEDDEQILMGEPVEEEAAPPASVAPPAVQAPPAPAPVAAAQVQAPVASPPPVAARPSGASLPPGLSPRTTPRTATTPVPMPPLAEPPAPAGASTSSKWQALASPIAVSRSTSAPVTPASKAPAEEALEFKGIPVSTPASSAPPGLRPRRAEPTASTPPPVAPPPAAPAAALRASATASSFTELELEADSLLHAVELAAQAGRAEQSLPAATEDEEQIYSLTEEVITDAPSLDALPTIPLFSDLPRDAFIELFELCPLRRFGDGERIIEQGSRGDAFYVICEGRVRVFREDSGLRQELATLEGGTFFGEMALLSGAPRTASVEGASEDTQLLEISAPVLADLSRRYPQVSQALKKFCRQRLLANVMSTSALFRPFNRKDRRVLVERFRARDVERDDVIIRDGDRTDGLYVVLSGEVEVQKDGHLLTRLKEGELFGEISLLQRTPATATVTASRHTTLLRLPREDFDQLISSHPQILVLVSELTDERLRRTQQVLDAAAPVPGQDGDEELILV